MATIKGILNGAGKIGGTYVRHIGGKTILSALPSSTGGNAKTPSQVRRQIVLPNIVHTYRSAGKGLMGMFEDKKPGVSDYNRFVGANTDTPVYLTKLMKQNKFCIAAPYSISEGSLQPIEVESLGEQALKTNIPLGDLVIDDTATVGAFSRAVCQYSDFSAHDRLTFWQVLQKETTINDLAIPFVEVRTAEFELDYQSPVRLWDAVPVGFESIDGSLGARHLPYGCFCWVHSCQPDATKPPQVSTQRLVNLNSEMYERYSSEEAFLEAAKSYGVRPTLYSPDTGF